MNEQANRELVEQAYQSVKTRDFQTFLNLLAEDIHWEMPEVTNVPFAGTWHGRQQVRQFFNRMAEAQDIVEFVPEEFIAQGNKVVVLGRFTMHVRKTGKDARSGWAHVWRVEGGKVHYMREYVDTLAVSRAHSPE